MKNILKTLCLTIILGVALFATKGDTAGLYAPPKWNVSTSTGAPASGYKLYFYSVGTTSPKDTYTTAAQTATNTNPVILDSRGEADIWFNGAYKVVLKTGADVTVWTVDNYGSDSSTGSSPMSGSNLVTNGSFEIDLDANSAPDNWTLAPYVTGAVARSASNQNHAAYVLAFTSVGAGGGTASTDVYQEVSPLQSYIVSYSIYSTAANVRNTVDIQWYTASKSLISTTNLYDDSTTNPTSATLKTQWATPPATARFAKLVFTGCHSSVATAGTTYVDGVAMMATVLPVPTSSAGKFLMTDGTSPSWGVISRNPIINGAMRIAQRGTVTPVINVDTYIIDRFYVKSAGAALTSAAQDTTAAAMPSNFQYNLKLTGAASVTTAEIAQRIEAANIIPFKTTVTFSAYIYNNTGAAFVPVVEWLTPTTTIDTFSAVTSRATDNAASCPNTTLTRITVTRDISAMTNIGLGLEIAINIPSGVLVASKYVHTTGWKLDIGPVATDFEFEAFSETLAKCQRYFWKTFAQGTAPAQAVGVFTGEIGWQAGKAGASVQYAPFIPFPVIMRTAPTMTFYNPVSANAQARDESAAADCSALVSPATTDRVFIVYVTGAAGTAVGNILGLHATASAEL